MFSNWRHAYYELNNFHGIVSLLRNMMCRDIIKSVHQWWIQDLFYTNIIRFSLYFFVFSMHLLHRILIWKFYSINFSLRDYYFINDAIKASDQYLTNNYVSGSEYIDPATIQSRVEQHIWINEKLLPIQAFNDRFVRLETVKDAKRLMKTGILNTFVNTFLNMFWLIIFKL